jgi:hypothetical protein
MQVFEDGTLMLFAAKKASYHAWRVKMNGSKLQWLGHLSGKVKGKMLGLPVMGNHAPRLASIHQGKISYRTLNPSDFGWSWPCSGL